MNFNLKMHDNSLFAVLLRSQWWISFAIAAAIVMLARMILPPAWAVYGMAGAIPFAVIGCIAAFKQAQKPSSGKVIATLEAVGAMNWQQFMPLLEEGYKRQGYTVARLKNVDAADLELGKDYRTTLVAGKRWKAKSVGVDPLRELWESKEKREAHFCVYVATGELSDQAKKYAAEKKIQVVQGPELAMLIKVPKSA